MRALTIKAGLLVSFSVIALGLNPLPARAQLPSAGDADPQGRVYTKIVVRTGEQGSQPVVDLPVYIVAENGDRITLRTSSAGVATTWLRKAFYRFVTPEPVRWGGRLYAWDTITAVRPGLALLQLGLSNAKPFRVATSPANPSKQAEITSRPPRQSVAGQPAPNKAHSSVSASNEQRASASTSVLESPAANTALATVARRAAVWSADDPRSDEILKNGHVVRSMARDGIAISTWIVRTDDLMWAYVSISNRSNRRVTVDPEQFTLDQLSPKQNRLKYRNPKDLANSINRRAKIGAALFAIGGEMARNETVTEVTSIGSSVTTGTSRTDARVSGLDPYGDIRVQARTRDRYSTTSRSNTTIRTSSPDDVARANAAAAAETIMAQASTKTGDILRSALLANTLMPGEDINGAVFFERDKKAREVLLRISLASLTYEVPLPIR